ncbi:MAG: hypothetical protein HIU91_15825, partial [Acidobacteria bacterium]|nr:hypothetical protein [Acidobacteriota bacterium]
MSAFNQDDLIAYHLHELPWLRARALRRALHTDPALASESDAIAATLLAFPKDDPAPPLAAEALDKYWLALLPALAAHAPKVAAPGDGGQHRSGPDHHRRESGSESAPARTV